jgi:hypothetical protein
MNQVLNVAVTYIGAMAYEYLPVYIEAGKKGWGELGAKLEQLPQEGWELFMAVPITGLTAIVPGLSGSKTVAIVHYFRRERVSGSN